MASVVFENIRKQYGDNPATIKGLHLAIADREFLVLVGPSGCGKSTALRMIAGLEDITGGILRIGDRVVNDVHPKNRDIAMVFQNYALYPHMNCYENMAFALKLRKVPTDTIREKVMAAAKSLEIEHLLEKKPKALSGGQRQRVAIGRAIVREPQVFLMDEPLSNLDAKLRVSMRAEIKKLHQRLQTTFVYVTHDQTEALTLGDRIAVMKGGDLQQCASPHEVYHRPANLFVATFIGSPQMNLFDVTVNLEGGQAILSNSNVRVRIPACEGLVDGSRVVMGLRPEHLVPVALEHATLRGKVEVTEPMGFETYVYLDAAARGSIIARLTGEHLPRLGDEIGFSVDPERVHLFDPTTEQRIDHGSGASLVRGR